MFHKNLHRYFLILLTPLILAARGNTSYCACAPGLVRRHCPDQAWQAFSPKITERLSPEMLALHTPR